MVMLTQGLVAEQSGQPWRCTSRPCDSDGVEVINTHHFLVDKALLDSDTSIKELNFCFSSSSGHSVCWPIGLEQVEDD